MHPGTRTGVKTLSSTADRGSAPAASGDPVIRQLREKISDVDRGLVDALNARLKLVAQLKRYKESRGIDFVDPEREEWMFNYLSRANRGPLTQEGLREIYGAVLDLTKDELKQLEGES
jgi:chorismate mutase